jgi:putative acetyltransferase
VIDRGPIRPATAADAPAVVALIERVYHEYGFVFIAQDETPDLLAFDATYDGRRGALYVAETGGVITGSVGVKHHAPAPAELVRLYVAAGARGAGLGQALVEHVIAWAHARAVGHLELWSDTRFLDAHRLYQRLGFVQGGQRQFADANDTVEHHFTLALAGRPPVTRRRAP